MVFELVLFNGFLIYMTICDVVLHCFWFGSGSITWMCLSGIYVSRTVCRILFVRLTSEVPPNVEALCLANHKWLILFIQENRKVLYQQDSRSVCYIDMPTSKPGWRVQNLKFVWLISVKKFCKVKLHWASGIVAGESHSYLPIWALIQWLEWELNLHDVWKGPNGVLLGLLSKPGHPKSWSSLAQGCWGQSWIRQHLWNAHCQGAALGVQLAWQPKELG